MTTVPSHFFCDFLWLPSPRFWKFHVKIVLLTTPFCIINLSFCSWSFQPAGFLHCVLSRVGLLLLCLRFCQEALLWGGPALALWNEVHWPLAGAHPLPSSFQTPGLLAATWSTGGPPHLRPVRWQGPGGGAMAVLRWAGFPTGQLLPQGRGLGRAQTTVFLHHGFPASTKSMCLPPSSAFGNTLVLTLHKTVVELKARGYNLY